MAAVYEDYGIRFRFPENWRLEQDEADAVTNISVTSPNTAFWSLTIHDASVTPQAAAETALAIMRDEYETLDAAAVSEPFGDWPAVGHDVHFLCLDLSNTCWIRAFRTPRHTLLVFCQVNDLELEATEPVFQAIGTSLEILNG